ncbi:glucose-1-phosphate adenylyltransferase subunit GlgD [Alkalibacterium iburiense]|uniref:Glucose-1-phosphate adenylyltransferase subunit GlgD n=1 Tax=Alkalibacterium iburiense TaxID=290589 RepID=A0ABN0X884_9LACT
MRNNIAAVVNLVEDDIKLKPLTNRRPVATLPFGCRYRLIDFPFSVLYNAQAESAALFISGSGHSLYDHIRSGSVWGLDSLAGGGVFTHSQLMLKSEKTQRKHDSFYYDDHYKYISKSKSNYVFLTGSSMLSNIQFDSLLHFHQEKDSEATIVYKKVKRNTLLKDTVTSRLSVSDEDPTVVEAITPLADSDDDNETVKLNMNMLIIDKKTFLDYLFQARENDLSVDVPTFITLALEEGKTVHGYEYTGYLKVVEDILSYYQANMDMLNDEHFNSLFYRAEPVLTRPKDSAPTYYGESAVVENSQFANDCQVYGTVRNSIVFRKVTIAENVEIENSIIMQDSTIEDDVQLKYVILDKHVYVKKGARLEGTPDNPIVISKDSVVFANGEIEEG